MVLGEVRKPGAYDLTKYKNDVAHALAMAGGLLALVSAQAEDTLSMDAYRAHYANN